MCQATRRAERRPTRQARARRRARSSPGSRDRGGRRRCGRRDRCDRRGRGPVTEIVQSPLHVDARLFACTPPPPTDAVGIRRTVGDENKYGLDARSLTSASTCDDRFRVETQGSGRRSSSAESTSVRSASRAAAIVMLLSTVSCPARDRSRSTPAPPTPRRHRHRSKAQSRDLRRHRARGGVDHPSDSSGLIDAPSDLRRAQCCQAGPRWCRPNPIARLARARHGSTVWRLRMWPSGRRLRRIRVCHRSTSPTPSRATAMRPDRIVGDRPGAPASSRFDDSAQTASFVSRQTVRTSATVRPPRDPGPDSSRAATRWRRAWCPERSG